MTFSSIDDGKKQFLMTDSLVNRSVTPLMTNLLPSAVGSDGRVNLFVGNVNLLGFLGNKSY